MADNRQWRNCSRAPPMQNFNENVYEAWDRFNDLLRGCPHHGFSELHQLDTFYNALNSNDQDSLNSAAGGNFLDKMPRECLKIIESKSKLSTSGSGTLPGNTVTNPKEDLKGITTRSGVTIQGPKAINHDTEVTKDTMPPANNGSTEDVQPPVVQIQSRNPNPEPNVAPVVTPIPKASIPFPSRRNDERRKEKANDQIEKFYEIFRDLSFEISFTSVILNKLPKKLGDPGRFLIPCEFTGITTCNALADLGASIHAHAFTYRSITKRIGIAEDVFVNVGKFQFPADFVVVDFEPDPRVPLILGRCFLKTSHALIDVYEGEITLRVGKEAITFNLDQTSKYTADYNHMTVNKIDVIDMACDEYSQEVLGFSNVIARSEGDILLLEAILNSEPLPPLPNHEQYMPGVRKELKLCEAKSSVDEPPEVELKELPPHLEYAFLEALLKVPQVHNRPSLGNSREIKGVSPEFCTHKILMDEDYEHLCKSQRGPWVSPGTLEPREIGMTVITNDENELIPTRLVTGWRVCIDYRKLNEATRKYHFPLPFMDTNVERLAGNQYYCFLDGFSGYFQIPINPKDQEKTTFTCPYGTFAYRRMPFGLCNAPGTFQLCMMAIFHYMIEKTMDRIMDDFLVFGTLSLRADPFGKDVEACETPICL
ncbi:reverse transcriptase domain-containing protein [Tanacetum coccineum]